MVLVRGFEGRWRPWSDSLRSRLQRYRVRVTIVFRQENSWVAFSPKAEHREREGQ